MTPQPMPCPTADQWKAKLKGSPAEFDGSDWAAHLEACSDCQETVEKLYKGRQTWLAVTDRLRKTQLQDSGYRATMERIKRQSPVASVGIPDQVQGGSLEGSLSNGNDAHRIQLPGPAKTNGPTTSQRIRFVCPQCQKQLSASSATAGKRTKCPKCLFGILIPSVTAGLTASPATVNPDDSIPATQRLLASITPSNRPLSASAVLMESLREFGRARWALIWMSLKTLFQGALKALVFGLIALVIRSALPGNLAVLVAFPFSLMAFVVLEFHLGAIQAAAPIVAAGGRAPTDINKDGIGLVLLSTILSLIPAGGLLLAYLVNRYVFTNGTVMLVVFLSVFPVLLFLHARLCLVSTKLGSQLGGLAVPLSWRATRSSVLATCAITTFKWISVFLFPAIAVGFWFLAGNLYTTVFGQTPAWASGGRITQDLGVFFLVVAMTLGAFALLFALFGLINERIVKQLLDRDTNKASDMEQSLLS